MFLKGFLRFTGLCLALSPCIAFAESEGFLRGQVFDARHNPIGNARVELIYPGQTQKLQATTNEAGTYYVEGLRLGDYQVQVQLQGYQNYSTTVAVGSGGAQLDIELKTTEMVMEVTAKKRMISRTASSRTEIGKEQIAKLPQGTEVSLPRLLATTNPGIVQGPFGQMFVRGNHANVQYQIDGVQLPDSPSNTFGQTISPRNIDRMEVITGGVPAEYGQRLSAVMNIVTKSGPEEPGGEIEMNYGSYNTFTPHLLYGGSNSSGDLHYFFSLNYNRTDRGLDTPQPVSETDQTQGGTESIHNTAYGNSEFAKVDWLADNSNKLTFVLSHSQSSFQFPNYPASFLPTSNFFKKGFSDSFGNQNADNPTYNYRPSDTDDSQSETNAFGQVVWKHMFGTHNHIQIAPYYRYSLVAVKNDLTRDFASLSIPSIVSPEPSSFSQNRHVNTVGLKTDYTVRPNEDHRLKTGFQVQASRADGWINVMSSPTAQGSNSDSNTGSFESVYVQDDYSMTSWLVLNAGLRFDANQFGLGDLNTSDYMFQPRVGLSFLTSDVTKLHIFYGKLYQAAPIETLRYQYNSGTSRLLEHFDIKAEKVDYYEVGIDQQIAARQLLSVNLYYKNGVNILDDHQLLNTPIAQPYNFAEGFGYGAELSVRGQIDDDWSEFFNYSYGMAKGKGISGGIFLAGITPNPDYQVLDHVQEHTANAGLTYSKNYFWGTLQGLYGSGLRTGENNSIALPGHFTMDTTLGYEFHGDSWLSKFKLSGDVLNVFNNVYPITVANGFNGSHYSAGRQFFMRLTKQF